VTFHKSFTWHLLLVAAAGSIAMTAGCGKPFNEQIDLIGTQSLAALQPAVAETELTGEPSLSAGLDRQGWTMVTVEVPTKQVAHYPTYVDNFRWQNQRGPWDPAYPTVEDAVVDQTDAGQDAADAVAEPVYRAMLLVWSPFDAMLGNWLWKMKRSPTEPYARVPDAVDSQPLNWFNAQGQPWYSSPPPAGEGDDEGDQDATGS
jgi:hypothetical protein